MYIRRKSKRQIHSLPYYTINIVQRNVLILYFNYRMICLDKCMFRNKGDNK